MTDNYDTDYIVQLMTYRGNVVKVVGVHSKEKAAEILKNKFGYFRSLVSDDADEYSSELTNSDFKISDMATTELVFKGWAMTVREYLNELDEEGEAI